MRNGASLYLQVYQHIKDAILNGRFRAGEMLPTEQQLMKEFGVSRITTNRALQMLSSEGFVTRRAGVGTFVSYGMGPAKPSIPKTEPATQEQVNRHLSTLVGFVIPFLNGSFGPSILDHTERLLNERGMSIALAASYGDQQKEAEAIHRLVRCGVKGLIVLPVNGEYYSEAILRLQLERFPIVLVDKSLPGIPLSYVTSDNYRAAKTLTEHLVSLHHTRIAFFSLPLDGTSTLMERNRGFVDSLDSHGIRPLPEYNVIADAPGSVENGLYSGWMQQLTDFLSAHPEVTAVLATDDHLAEHVLAAAMQVGRSVPEQLSIACFDGPSVRKTQWNFSRVIQNEAEMARHCIRILDELWSGQRTDDPESVIVPCEMIVGQSTAEAPAICCSQVAT